MLSSLSTRGLTVRYGTGRTQLVAVDDVDLDVPEGGTLGIVGESGCGKSTLAKALVGLERISGGQIFLGSDDMSEHRSRTTQSFRRRVQMVFQDPHSSFDPRMTIGKALGEAVDAKGLAGGRKSVPSEVLRLIDLVGLQAGHAQRFPHELSGGQKQRLAIARALAVGARLIVLDEVTSALDVSVQAAVVNLLKDLQRELGLSYVFISHDLSVVRAMSDSVMVMYLGRVIERAPGVAIFDQPAHPYTQALVSSIPALTTVQRPEPLAGDMPDPRNPPNGCRFHTRCPAGPLRRDDRALCFQQDPSVGSHRRLHEAACHFSPVGASSDLRQPTP